MKAKVIKTGEVLEVYQTSTGWASGNLNVTRFFKESDLDFDYCEWEAFRREAAKDILCAMIHHQNSTDPIEVSIAIDIANELIRQLKGERNENKTLETS